VLDDYEAWERGDIDAATESAFTPDVEWIEPPEFPNGGARGPATVREYPRASPTSWLELHSERRATTLAGDVVVVHQVHAIHDDGSKAQACAADVYTVGRH
jgi:ketosteroid isomerase-like protein